MKLFLKILCVLLCTVALVGLLAACDGSSGSDGEPNTSQTDKAANITSETPTDGDTRNTQSPSGNDTAPNVTPDINETGTPNVTDTSDVSNTPTDTAEPTDTSTPDDTTTVPSDTTTVPDDTTDAPEIPEMPNWGELPKVNNEIAYSSHSVGYIDGVCTVKTNYNERNMILGARYEIFAYARYYLETRFTYAENGPLTELYIEMTGSEWYRFTFEYDAEGKLVSAKFFNAGKEKPSLTPTIEYYSNGLIKKISNKEFTQEFDLFGRLVYENIDESDCYIRYEYDGDAINPQKALVFSDNEKYNMEMIPSYGENGKASAVENKYVKSGNTETYNLQYDQAGNATVIDYAAKDADGKVMTSVLIENTYDEKGNITKILRTRPTEKEEFVFVYDSENRVVEEIYSEHEGDALKYKDITTVTYGDNGKLSHKLYKSYDKNGLKQHSEYSYEYFAGGELQKETWTLYYPDTEGKIQILDIEEYDENGNRIKSTTYSYDKNGKIINYDRSEENAEGRTTARAYLLYWDENEGGCFIEEEFNANGKTVKFSETYYAPDGKKLSKSTENRYYDESGKLTKTAEVSYYGNGVLSYKVVKTFDSNEKCITEAREDFREDGSFNSKSSHTYSYHENGNLKTGTYIEYYSGGVVRRKEISTYDENGNGISGEVFEYNADGVLTGRRFSESIVDKNGNETGSVFTYYDGNGRFTGKEVNEYERDSNGSIKRETQTFYCSDNTIETAREWLYDDDGECISETSKQNYYPNGNAGLVEITRYDYENRKGTNTCTEYDIDGNVIYTHTETFDL